MTDTSPAAVHHLEQDLRRHLERAVDGIPGVTGAHLSASSYASSFTVTFRMEGWSPTLHPVRIVRTDSLKLTREAVEAAADSLPRIIDAVADLQRHRVDDAARLGHGRPLPTREIDHVDIDSALPALRGDGVEATRAAVLEAVRRGHATANDYDGGHAMRSGGVLIGDGRSDDGGRWLRVVAPSVKIRSADGKRQAKLWDFELDLEADHLPDTILSALVGRPLGDLVRIHPGLDERTIRRASNRTTKARPGILIGLDMHVDPIGEVLGRHEAAAARAA